jgi:hypothetical protein
MDMKIFKILFALAITSVSLCCVSCDESDPYFDLQNGDDLQLFDYYIDEYGNEGVVMYVINASKWYHTASYKIVISLDEGYDSWGPMDHLLYKCDSIRSSDVILEDYGVAMHQLMHHIGIEKFPAQAWCHKKNMNEKHQWAGSWRLPTISEWKYVNNYLTGLNTALKKYGGTPLNKNQMYWTCQEDYDQVLEINGEVNQTYDPMNKAIALTPTYKVIVGNNKWLKSNKYNVRAIKYIYYQVKE